MKPIVELIYDSDCPNVPAARQLLCQAFSRARLQPDWREFDRNAIDSPTYAKRYGSPTILVNGRDVADGKENAGGSCCRLYESGSGPQKVPDIDRVVRALKATLSREGNASGFQWKKLAAAIPGFIAVVIPVGHCPACWPAYAGILSAFGLGFLFNATYMIPILSVLLLVALLSLGWRAQSRHGYSPFWLGVCAAVVIIGGKFVLANDLLVCFGLALLMVACIWNAWPLKEVSCER